MRVLMVSQPLDGGVYRHVTDLCRGLTGRGHDVALAGPWTELPDSEGAFLPVDVPMQREVSAGEDARSVAVLASTLRELAPDVVHAHSTKAGAVARLARCTRPAPVVYTPHGFAFAGCFSPSRRRAYWAAERLLAPLTSALVAVCEAERNLARQVKLGSRARVVHNGVMVPDVCAEEEPDVPTLTALALFRPGKGLETLLDALPQILADVPNARLRLIGDGPQRPALEQRARQLGVHGRVDLVGATTDVRTAMRGTSVFVHPSWAEAFPYAVLDALAVGLPVVATDVGGIGEAVLDGRTGRLVQPRDSHALALAVVALLRDRAQAARLGRQGRDHVRKFSVDDMVTGAEKVYASVVQSRR